MPRRSRLLPCLLLLGLIGCTSIGPPTLRRDRLDYADAMAEASKRETLMNILGELRADGDLGFRFDTETGPRTAQLLLADREGHPLDPRARRLLELLGLDPDLRSFPIRFGFSEGRPGEIRIYTRSLIEILGALAVQVEVPQGDIAAGRTFPTHLSPAELPALPNLTVMSRPAQP